MHLFLFCFLLAIVRAQQSPCFCSCCSGISCNPTFLPTIYVHNCTLERCIVQCRDTYVQCRGNQPTTVISVQCGPTAIPQYTCRCDCCKTGSPFCSVSYIGNAITFICAVESCSIACANQYPHICVANQVGQTQGTCMSPLTSMSTSSTTTTTTTLTTTPPPPPPTTTVSLWLGNTCSCMCCRTGSYCSPMNVGTTLALQCSSGACTQACQNQYPALCPVFSNIGQTIGTCISGTDGNTICKCNCCSGIGCMNYETITNDGCFMCDSMCRHHSPCIKPDHVTHVCYRSNAKLSLPWFTFIFIMNFSIFLIIQ
ncbi:unnamed protein product [Rotaria magnacalcarata]